MNSFKKFVLAAVLAVVAMGGVAVIDSPVVGTQRTEAAPPSKPVAPWFAKVYYKGKAGYLGGYKTKADAIKYAQLWVKGVGAKNGASFRGEVIYNPKN